MNFAGIHKIHAAQTTKVSTLRTPLTPRFLRADTLQLKNQSWPDQGEKRGSHSALSGLTWSPDHHDDAVLADFFAYAPELKSGGILWGMTFSGSSRFGAAVRRPICLAAASRAALACRAARTGGDNRAATLTRLESTPPSQTGSKFA
jgi:hypothetical protein